MSATSSNRSVFPFDNNALISFLLSAQHIRVVESRPSQMDRRRSNKEKYLKNYLNCSETMFAALDTDYINDFNISGPNTLLEKCMDLILSDWYISRCLEGKIPKVMGLKLLTRALETNRILSIKYLLQRFPLEEFVFPVPDNLKLCALLVQKNLPAPILNSIRNMKDTLNIIVNSFKNVVIENNGKSNLRILNFSQLPHEETILRNICKMFEENRRSITKQYVVKGTFVFLDQDDYENFIRYKETTSANLNIILTGMYCLRIPVHQLLVQLVIDVFDIVDDQEMQFLSLDFVFPNLPKFIPSIKRFKNLTTLFLTYIEGLRGDVLDDLAQIIYELPDLKNLGIRSSKITNNLQSLLMKNCEVKDGPQAKKIKVEGDRGCCAIHRGKLRYLDVSYCSLVDADLQCLEEYPFCANLKHLSIGSNQKLTTERLADCLEHMASNLVILDMHSAFYVPSNLQPLINIFYKFKMLKFLVLGFIRFQDNQFHSFAKSLFDVPCLKEVQMRLRYISEVGSPTEDQMVNWTNSLSEKGVHVHRL